MVDSEKRIASFSLSLSLSVLDYRRPVITSTYSGRSGSYFPSCFATNRIKFWDIRLGLFDGILREPKKARATIVERTRSFLPSSSADDHAKYP